MLYTELLMNRILSNEELKSFFISEIKSTRLSHAYIIEGPAGSGKLTLSLTLLACLAGDERGADLIMSNNAADVTVIAPEEGKKSIGIAAVRAVRETVPIKSNDLEFKAYIIRNAELMTVQAQNALLKMLEEPPKNVYFFLNCENTALLLPTVRSRAPSVRMKGLTPDELDGYLTKSVPAAAALKRTSPEEYGIILQSSGGSLGKAIAAFGTGAEGREAVSDGAILSIIECLADKNKTGLYLAVNNLPPKRDKLLPCLVMLATALRDTTAVKFSKAGNDTELFFGHRDKISELSSRLTMAQLLGAYELVTGITASVNANINIQNAKVSLSEGLWKQNG